MFKFFENKSTLTHYVTWKPNLWEKKCSCHYGPLASIVARFFCAGPVSCLSRVFLTACYIGVHVVRTYVLRSTFPDRGKVAEGKVACATEMRRWDPRYVEQHDVHGTGRYIYTLGSRIERESNFQRRVTLASFASVCYRVESRGVDEP